VWDETFEEWDLWSLFGFPGDEFSPGTKGSTDGFGRELHASHTNYKGPRNSGPTFRVDNRRKAIGTLYKKVRSQRRSQSGKAVNLNEEKIKRGKSFFPLRGATCKRKMSGSREEGKNKAKRPHRMASRANETEKGASTSSLTIPNIQPDFSFTRTTKPEERK